MGTESGGTESGGAESGALSLGVLNLGVMNMGVMNMEVLLELCGRLLVRGSSNISQEDKNDHVNL